MPSVTTIFPTSIYSDVISRPLSEEELSFIKNIKYVANQNNLVSEDNYVLNHPEMLYLKLDLLKICNDYFKIVHCANTDVYLDITQSWLNKTQKSEKHHKHHHYNSFASGVYYIETSESDSILFEQDIVSPFRFDTTEWNLFNSKSWSLPTPKNSVLLFPSMLEHSVNVKSDDSERISLAFNCFFKGRLGSADELTELIL